MCGEEDGQRSEVGLEPKRAQSGVRHLSKSIQQWLLERIVSWCFEPSQPQRMTSGLKRNFSLSPSYSLNKL